MVAASCNDDTEAKRGANILRRAIRDAGLPSFCLVVLTVIGLIWAYATFFADRDWRELPLDESVHVCLNGAVVVWVAVNAWRGRGQLDQKLSQVANATIIAYGVYGDASEFRAGANIYPVRERGFRVNGEWIHVNNSPVGYTAYPMPVGANGNLFHLNMELNF